MKRSSIYFAVGTVVALSACKMNSVSNTEGLKNQQGQASQTAQNGDPAYGGAKGTPAEKGLNPLNLGAGAIFISHNYKQLNHCVLMIGNTCDIWRHDALNGTLKTTRVDQGVGCSLHTSNDFRRTRIQFSAPVNAFNGSQAIEIASIESFANGDGKKHLEMSSKFRPNTKFVLSASVVAGTVVFGETENEFTKEVRKASFGVLSNDRKVNWTVWPASFYNCESMGVGASGVTDKTQQQQQTPDQTQQQQVPNQNQNQQQQVPNENQNQQQQVPSEQVPAQQVPAEQIPAQQVPSQSAPRY